MSQTHDAMMRPLTEVEREVLAAIAEAAPDKVRAQLVSDLKIAQVDETQSTKSLIWFGLSGYDRSGYEGQHSYGVEGTIVDADGARMDVDLFADKNDRLLLLEIIRYDPGSVVSPDWRTLTLDRGGK